MARIQKEYTMKTGIVLAVAALSFGLTVSQAYAANEGSEGVGTLFPAHVATLDTSAVYARDTGSEAAMQTASSLPQPRTRIAAAHSAVHTL